MIVRELERKRKTFVERRILRKAGLKKKKSYFSYLSFYPLSLSPQSAELSEWRAEWGGLSLNGGGSLTSFFPIPPGLARSEMLVRYAELPHFQV